MLNCKPVILLNNFCNFKCCHCYVKCGDKELPVEYFKDFYNYVIKPNNASCISIAGGEPMLYSHFHELAKYIASIHKPGINFNITTNGSCITDEIIDDLKLINPNLIKVSLLTMREDKYKSITGVDFPLNKTLDNVKKLKQYFNVGINMTIMKDTLCDVKTLFEFCLTNEIHDLFLSQLTPAGRGYDIREQRLDESQIKEVKELISKVDPTKLNIRYDDGCSCGFNQNFVLNWDGNVFPCAALASYPEYKIGKYNTNIETMRNNIKNLNKYQTKTCFVEEFVDY